MLVFQNLYFKKRGSFRWSSNDFFPHNWINRHKKEELHIYCLLTRLCRLKKLHWTPRWSWQLLCWFDMELPSHSIIDAIQSWYWQQTLKNIRLCFTVSHDCPLFPSLYLGVIFPDASLVYLQLLAVPLRLCSQFHSTQFHNQTTGKSHAWMVNLFFFASHISHERVRFFSKFFDWLNDCKVLNSNAWTLQVTQHEMRWDEMGRQTWIANTTHLKGESYDLFKELCWHMSEKIEENHEKPKIGHPWNILFPVYSSTTTPLCSALLKANVLCLETLVRYVYQSVIQLNRIQAWAFKLFTDYWNSVWTLCSWRFP